MFSPRSPRALRAVGLLLVLRFSIAPASAVTTFCVGTSAELAAALGQVNALGGADAQYVIKLRPGDYVNDLPSAGHAFVIAPNRSDQSVTLSGGWSANCQSRSYGSPRTTLIGTTQRRALEFRLDDGNHSGNRLRVHDVDLRNLAFDLPEDNHAACLAGTIGPGNEATIERMALQLCRAIQGETASILIYNRGELVLRNVVVTGGVARNNGGIGVVTFDHGVSRLAQISVTRTRSQDFASPGSGIALLNVNAAVTHLSNSVTWGNDPDAGTADLLVEGPGITLTRVHYGELETSGGAPAANVSPSIGNPGFVAVDDAHLRADSILVDSGVFAPPGGAGTYDLDGNPRKRGPAIDVGAFEMPSSDRIFIHGFEPG